MPISTTDEFGVVTVTYSPEERIEGLTKARLAANLVKVTAKQPIYNTNTDYSAYVTAQAGLADFPDRAAESYFDQFAGTTIEGLQAELDAAVAAQLAAEAENPPAEPTPIPPVSAAAVWEAIKKFRDKLKSSGVQVAGKWFHSDADSRIQQLGLVMMGAQVPPVQWKTMDGSFVTMSQTLAMQIFQATAASDMAIFTIAEQHRAGVYAAAEASAYDWHTGWPATFAG